MIPDTVTNFLERQRIDFEVVTHRPTATSLETVHAAHIPGEQLAKAVVFEDGERYLLAVIPATNRVDPWALADLLDRDVFIANEDDFRMVFRDCRPGAVPPIGQAYGMSTVVDDALIELPEVFFECGDHEHVIRVDRTAFAQLMQDAPHGAISYHL